MKNVIRFLVLSMLCSIITLNAYRYELAVCAVFQNEARFLKEWIEFHMLVGVEHFYLYDDSSIDNCEEVLRPYIERGLVDYIRWDKSKEQIRFQFQSRPSNHCLNEVRGMVKWLMFIDIDEFVFPVQCNDLREFLKEYEEFGAVCVNWVMFGTSGVKKIPENKLLIECLTSRSSLGYSRNKTVKTIVRPERVDQMGVHRANRMVPGCFEVTANKERFIGKKTPLCEIDKIRINHYWVRDEKFLYEVKLPRMVGRNTDKWMQKQESESFLKSLDLLNKEKDTAIGKYVRRLRKKMFDLNS